MTNDMEIVERRSYQVVKANEIIQKARYDLNARELKTLSYLISLVKPSDKKGTWYVTSVKDYCRVRGIDCTSGNNYAEIKKTIKKLRDTSFWLMNEDGKEVTVGWLGKVELDKRSGRIRFCFDMDLEKYIFGLFSDYTQYELLCTLPMKSAHSIRIYEILKSRTHNESASVPLDIDEIKKRLGCEEAYNQFRDFKRRVLDVAVREINLYTDLDVSYQKILSGKTVSKLLFEVHKKDMTGRIISYNNAEAILDRNDDQVPGQMHITDYLK